MNVFTSWKTTLTGIVTLLGGLGLLGTELLKVGTETPPTWEALMAGVAAVTAGFGLIFARDNSTSSEEAGAK